MSSFAAPRQSAVFGSADLGRAIGDFEGPASDSPAFVAGESFERLSQDVPIPMTELRITWLHPLGERVSLGVTANASIWFDVPVPPKISPTASSSGFDESTIVFLGIGAAIRFNF